MKKLFSLALTLAVGVTCTAAIVGCNPDSPSSKTDAELAKQAIATVEVMYADKAVDTPSDYTLTGQTKVDGTTYDVNWSVSSTTVDNLSDYVTVGTMDESTKLVTVSITTSDEVIEYKLTASVTVGEATETTSFNRRIPVLGKIYTAAEAQALGESLEADAYYEENGLAAKILVKGYVVDPGTYSSQYNNWTSVYIADTFSDDMTKDSEGTFLVFRLGKDDTYLKGEGYLEKGDLVTLEGYLQNYKGNTVELTYHGSTSNNPTCIALTKAQRTDAEKVAAAKAAVDSLIPKTYSAKGTVDLPTESFGATLSWTVKETSDLVSISDNTMTIAALPEAEADVTLTITITSGKETETVDVTIKVAPASDKGTLENPFMASEALEIAKSLANNAYYEVNGVATQVYVEGYVVDAGTWSAQYNNWTRVYIADSASMTQAEGIQVYRLVLNNSLMKDETEFEVGAHVVVYGYLQNYYGNTPQVTYNGSTNPTMAAYEKATNADKIASALAKVADILTVSTAGETALPTSSIAGVTFAWSTNDTKYTVTDGKLNIAELPDADVTITLNVTATCGNATDTKTVTVTIQAPSQNKTASVVMKDYATAKSWDTAGKVVYDTVNVDSNITVNVTVETFNTQYGRNSGKFYTDNWRIYQNENPSITFTAAEGCTILTVKITYTVNNTGILTSADKTTQYASDTIITVNAATISFTVDNTGDLTNGQVRITAIEVVYTGASGDVEPEHTHFWGYAYVEGTQTHKRTCSAEGCDIIEETVECTPVLNVCSDCNHKYSEADILAALFALEAGKSLNGTYELTGEIIAIKEISEKYSNATFTIKVADKEIVAFRAKGTGYETLKVGDTVTITGSLMHYSDGTIEFGSGCMITEIKPGEGEDPGHGETPEEKEGITLLFKENIITYVDERIVWSLNGLTVTNEQDESSTKCTNYKPEDVGHARIYKGAKLKIEYNGMTEIVFHCNTTSYATTLEGILKTMNGLTVTVDGKDVKVVFATASNSLEFSAAAQIRIDSIEVKAETATTPGEGENPGQGGDETPTESSSLSFADKANRKTSTTEQQVWEQNGVVFTYSKADASNFAEYDNPIRCYANTTIKVAFKGMKEIVFHCNSTKYADALKASLETAGYTVTVDGEDVKVVFETACDSIECTLTAQVRINSIDVKA